MTLASCVDRNITKRERRAESPFDLVNHRVNLPPMGDGLLPRESELGLDYVLGAKSTIIKRAIGICPPISKLITSLYASGRTHRVESAVTAYRTCAQTE